MRAIITVLLLAITAAPALAGDGRLALIVARTDPPAAQPALDRWANDVAKRFASMFSVSIVPAPVSGDTIVQNREMCDALNVAGFLEPARQWSITASTVTVDAQLIIFDCNGIQLFDGSSEQSAPRNPAMAPQAQIDSTSRRATTKVLQQVAAFKRSHQTAWSRLLTTGSLSNTPSPFPMPSLSSPPPSH